MLDKIVDDVQNWMKKIALMERTRTELQRLSDKELRDLGISRSEIDRVAREACYATM
jgi:hypothetical protein